MENELEVVNIRLVREPSLYSEQILDSPQAVVELMAKELSQYDREVFCILNMKNNGQVINMKNFFILLIPICGKSLRLRMS